MQDIFKIVFLSLIGLIAVGLIIFLAVVIYKKIYLPTRFRNAYYRTVLTIVQNEDYRLINNFIFRAEEDKYKKIDHIIFGEKYIYLVLSRYYEGDLKGKFEDKSLVFIPHKGNKRYYTENPYKSMESVVKRLCITSGLDASYLICVTLVNDSCKITTSSKSTEYYICNKKHLKKLIKECENRNIGPINEKQLQSTILTLSQMNRRKRN